MPPAAARLTSQPFYRLSSRFPGTAALSFWHEGSATRRNAQIPSAEMKQLLKRHPGDGDFESQRQSHSFRSFSCRATNLLSVYTHYIGFH
jgi:hypothetical protein